MSLWISFILNCAVAFMVIFALAAGLAGWNFMGVEGSMDEPGLSLFKYFTVLSNILAGICCIGAAAGELLFLTGVSEKLSPVLYVLKFIGSSAVTLTLMVTAFFLRPQFENPASLYYNGNLFFHLIVPVVSDLSFIFFERHAPISFPETLLGPLPTVLYTVFYTTRVFRHLDNGRVDKNYDFYNFLNGKKEAAPAVIPIIISISYLLGLLLWWFNRIGRPDITLLTNNSLLNNTEV